MLTWLFITNHCIWWIIQGVNPLVLSGDRKLYKKKMIFIYKYYSKHFLQNLLKNIQNPNPKVIFLFLLCASIHSCRCFFKIIIETGVNKGRSRCLFGVLKSLRDKHHVLHGKQHQFWMEQGTMHCLFPWFQTRNMSILYCLIFLFSISIIWCDH